MRRCATTLEAEMSPAEHEFLLELLQNEKLSGQHLEIGTAAGGTLCQMMHCFEDQHRPKFVVVDPMRYFPDQLPSVRRNLDRHGLNSQEVDFRVHTSADAFAASAARQESFDFMLIDGCHKILSVMTDLRWTRLLTVGGIVCLHDYCWKHKGVLLAVNRFLASHPNYEAIGCVDSLLALRKKSPSRIAEVTPAAQLYAFLLYLPLQVERKLTKRSRVVKKAA
jgi:predicted O-methyltransferase YrrM